MAPKKAWKNSPPRCSDEYIEVLASLVELGPLTLRLAERVDSALVARSPEPEALVLWKLLRDQEPRG
jgi:hypothetical protein